MARRLSSPYSTAPTSYRPLPQRDAPIARYVEFSTQSHVDELITVPFRPDAEWLLTIPDAPGLGIELNRAALDRFGVSAAH